MSIFKKILFATDLSRQTEKLSHHVRYFATFFQAELHVVSVVERPPDPSVAYHDMLDDTILESYERELLNQAETSLRQTVDKYFSDIDAKFALLMGEIPKKIINYAKDNAIDLIIMGSATKSGIAEKIFGSNASKVIAQAPCPVMTINPLKIKNTED